MTLSKFRFVSLLFFASYKVTLSFTVVQPAAFSQRQLIVSSNKKEAAAASSGAWSDDEHLAHGLAQVHEETNDELLESEMTAVDDAHDSIDAGMEAAAEERAVMLAHDLIHEMKVHPKATKRANNNSKWTDEHVSHGIAQLHEESDEELLESEMAAAEDAHDSSDAGMEAAAEERAVMLAHELIHEMKVHPKPKKADNNNNKWSEEHVSHGIEQLHEETDEELLASEMAAAEDAHDSSDAGMEAAAEERAVMLAHELIHEMREKALKNKKNQTP